MKNTFRLTFTLLITMFISSCSSDETTKDETYLYKSEKINFTEIVNSQIGNKYKSSKDSNSDDYIHSELETTFYIPENLSDVELENYIVENQNSINGTIKYLINDGEFVTIEIINGIGTFVRNETAKNRLAYRYPCSYDGIQDCVQHAVYEEWTTIEALICAATGGLECIAVEAAACIEQSCF